jgi:hypothetical protein
MADDIDQMLKEDWRELGFFYDHDKDLRSWQLTGSRSGLLNFCTRLKNYVAKPGNEKLGEHEHFEPYWYLTIITSDKNQITDYGIFGTLQDLNRLADIVYEKLQTCNEGDTFAIDDEYADTNEAKLEFIVKEEGFDPASADKLLP